METTIVLPLFLFLALGAVDAAFLLSDWVRASKAVYMGARKAVVSSPVPSNITAVTFDASKIGQWCFVDTTTGTTTGINLNCPAPNETCTATGGSAATAATCSPGSYSPNVPANFDLILQEMRKVMPQINAENVTISYVGNGSGYVGELASYGGLPMNVTVRLRCMTHEYIFIGALMGWVFPAPSGCASTLKGPALPAFSTTMQSEDMTTNN